MKPQTTLRDRLPVQAVTLFEAKAAKNMTFEDIAKQLGRNEVAVAAIFYGQAQTTPEDVEKLSSILGVDHGKLSEQLAGYPFRGQVMDMPPREPLIYRLYEIVQNYGYAYKAILNEKFGDGIMSAISFSTKVEKETDKDGNNWAVITLRGKWYVVRPTTQNTTKRCHKQVTILEILVCFRGLYAMSMYMTKKTKNMSRQTRYKSHLYSICASSDRTWPHEIANTV